MLLLNLNSLEKSAPKSKFKYSSINKFPGAKFDCTVDVDINEPVGDILTPLRKVKSKLLKSTSIKDVFVHGDRKFVTISSDFLNTERTLEGTEIKELETLIITNLEKNNYFLKK